MLSACLPETVESAVVSGPDADGAFKDKDGARYFATDLRGAEDGMTGMIPASAAPIEIRAYPAGQTDRWGTRPAWIVAKGSDKAALLQYHLLERGREVFAPRHASDACADFLLDAEHSARRRKAGLWAEDPQHRVFSAGDPNALEAAAGDYVIVQGRIVSLGKTRTTRYLNFGRYWKVDFTVTVGEALAAPVEARLALAGLSFAQLAGRAVEIRGVVQIDDGPLVDLRHPAQLLVLD